MFNWLGNAGPQLHLALYADADFEGCPETNKSTAGAFLCLQGPNTCFAFEGRCKKQQAVSNSTPESEIVAAAYALRTLGLPIMAIAERLWREGFNAQITLILYEDNQAAVRVFETGRNPTMRSLNKSHSISLAQCHNLVSRRVQELGQSPPTHMSVVYCDTRQQRADIFTKPFTNQTSWANAVPTLTS